MRAITIESPGGPEVLRVSEVPDPVPGADEVLIDIAAAGLTGLTCCNGKGSTRRRRAPRITPGWSALDASLASGANVTGFAVGDEVCALLAGGGYAEKVAVDAGQVLPIPDGTSLTGAAGLMEVACTVYSNVVHLAGLAAGETLLIHGGGQRNRDVRHPARPGSGRSRRLHGRVRRRSSTAAWSWAPTWRSRYRDQDFVEAIGEFTGGRGADVILDIMGATYLPAQSGRAGDRRAARRHRPAGRHQGRARSRRDAEQATRPIRATSLRARPTHEKAAIVAGVAELVWPLVAAGEIKPDHRHRAAARRSRPRRTELMEADRHIGKILLRP